MLQSQAREQIRDTERRKEEIIPEYELIIGSWRIGGCQSPLAQLNDTHAVRECTQTDHSGAGSVRPPPQAVRQGQCRTPLAHCLLTDSDWIRIGISRPDISDSQREWCPSMWTARVVSTARTIQSHCSQWEIGSPTGSNALARALPLASLEPLTGSGRITRAQQLPPCPRGHHQTATPLPRGLGVSWSNAGPLPLQLGLSGSVDYRGPRPPTPSPAAATDWLHCALGSSQINWFHSTNRLYLFFPWAIATPIPLQPGCIRLNRWTLP